MTPRRSQSAFTLVEIITATAILVMAVTLSLAGFVYSLRESRRSSVQSELDMDVQKSVESLKVNLRLSSLTNMYFYPAGAGPYKAISFPLARDDDGDGAVDTTNNMIIWDKTLIYHVWDSKPNQLRLTTIDPRGSLNAEALQTQLNYVVTNGNGRGVYSNAVTTVIFQNLFDWSITPRGSTFDGYAPTTTFARAVLGMTAVTSGPQTLKFTVTGRNPLSTGYKAGVDTLFMSPSGLLREGEDQLPATAFAGVAPSNQYIEGGDWSGNSQLLFPATATGQTFTLTMSNDRWEESQFLATGALQEDSTVEFDKSLTPPHAVVRLAGVVGGGWLAADQTGDTTNYPYGSNDSVESLRGCAVRVLIRGDQMAGGGWIPYNSGRCYVLFRAGGNDAGKQLRIDEASIAECASPTNVVPDALPGTIHQLLSGSVSLSGGAGVYVGCVNCTSRHPIDKRKSYLVTYLVSGGESQGYAKYWNETRDSAFRGCYIITNATAADVTAPVWTGRAFATNRLYGVEHLYTYFAPTGTFTSAIVDTHQRAATSAAVTWSVDVPSGASFAIKARAGNQPDMSDAPAWSSVPALASGAFNISGQQYLQFQTVMNPDYWCYLTPKLRGVTFSWPGPTSMVDVGGSFTKGPDYGIFEARVNGKLLMQGITVDLTIFEDVYTRAGARRVTSSLTSEIRPRNK